MYVYNYKDMVMKVILLINNLVVSRVSPNGLTVDI